MLKGRANCLCGDFIGSLKFHTGGVCVHYSYQTPFPQEGRSGNKIMQLPVLEVVLQYGCHYDAKASIRIYVPPSMSLVHEYLPPVMSILIMQDGGTPARSITNTLAITVQDALDPQPTFTESVYSINIIEGIYNNVRMNRNIYVGKLTLQRLGPL